MPVPGAAPPPTAPITKVTLACATTSLHHVDGVTQSA